MSSVEHSAAIEAGRAIPAAPVSTIPWRDGLLGLAGLTIAWLAVMLLETDPFVGSWVVLLATAMPMLAAELHRAAAAKRRAQDWALLAFAIGLPLAGLPFLLFHLQGGYLQAWLLAWVVAAPAFALRFLVEWMRTGAVSLGFPAQLGRVLLAPNRTALRSLAAPSRLFALKAVFIPLYAMSLFALIRIGLGTHPVTALDWLMLALIFAYTIDLGFGLAGYVFSSNDVLPTVRSTQPRLIGWVVCIVCYGPIVTHWPALETVVRAEIAWPVQMQLNWATGIAAAAMLALFSLYISATVCFGLRFSNLANRGVLTAGPYRLMKHPAYFAHAGNAWLLCLVLLPSAGIELGISRFLIPLVFTALYWARSRTEEMHMREDPDYVAYERWIAQHGLLANIIRLVRRT